MKTQIKQRILGILALLIVVAIILPVFFHHQRPAVVSKLTATETPALTTASVDTNDTIQAQQRAAIKLVEQTPATAVKLKPKAVLARPAAHVSPVQVVTKKLTKLSVQPQLKNMKLAQTKAVQSAKLKQIIKDESSTLQSLQNIHAWSIRLGSFSDKANAARLVKRLRVQGYDTYIRTHQSKRALNVVYVGPEISLRKAQRVLRQLQRRFHLRGVIKPYRLRLG
ncbi:MAG: SPOR domain-containing protein [Gammaproteobacteria bacterium]|nr:SPOR domain-containing protein [Gammaproteobacteria bacterium]